MAVIKCHEIFPLGPDEMSEKKCAQTIGLLSEAEELETTALELLDNIIYAK